MGKLMGLRVERVDGVGSPATGKTWVILKSTATPEAVAKSEEIVKAAGSALTALLKEATDGLELSKETTDALHALAALLEVEAEFTAKSVEAPEAVVDPPAAVDPPAGEPDEPVVSKETYTADEVEALLAETLEKAGVELDDDGEPVAKAAKPVVKSKQLQGTGEATVTKSKGEGIFENVIFQD